jgi:selenide,water dikinase
MLVGAEHFSDAGVYLVADDLAIVQSVDFFPPLVDDPYLYGQIAAANSMSDVYAMGGDVRTALNIVAFPDDKLELAVLSEILRGGAERVKAAGAVLLGGHSVRDAEIKYGLSVTGVVRPSQLITNEAAAPGDVLILTKALGTGFITTANRAGRCPADVLDAACRSMMQLNREASRVAVDMGVRAAIDITGFGLAAQALEMARASNVCITLELARLPLLPGAEDLAVKANFTRANATNRAHVEPAARFDAEPRGGRAEFLFDPQTSGGLLLCVAADRADELLRRCRAGGAAVAAIVGSVQPPGDVAIVVRD